MRLTIKKLLLTIKKEWLNWILKLNHWAIFMMAIFLGVTGWLGCTAFSVPNLMKDVMDFAFPIAEIDAGAGARFILSRVIRGQMYQYHFLVGVIMYAAMIVGFVLGFTKKGITKNPITILFLISMTLLLISGWFRYYRGTLPIMEIGYYRGLFRNIHHYSAWALLWTSIAHIVHMVYLNATKYQNIISHMFKSGPFILKTLLCIMFIGLSINGTSAYASLDTIYETLNTKVKMSSPKINGEDDLFLRGIIPSSKESAEVLADFYWAKKCTNSLDGVVLWNEKERFCRSRKFALLLDLKKQSTQEAFVAYQTIILSERINNCGSHEDLNTFLHAIQQRK